MVQRMQRRGKCGYCEKDFSVGGMTRHLSACPRRKEIVAEGDRKRGRNMGLYHLRAQDEWRKDFWIDLEVKGSATLEDLDHYLRYIWLECCGHLSMFSRDRWMGNEVSAARKVADIFEPGVQITHIYDFGDSSNTLIRNVSVRNGKPTVAPYPIALMARNNQPEFDCISCDRSASWLCIECIYEDDVWGTLCQQHSDDHPHDSYGGPLPLVNSPRIGMCGYDGPAEPPY